jgi:hypothetical protein
MPSSHATSEHAANRQGRWQGQRGEHRQPDQPCGGGRPVANQPLTPSFYTGEAERVSGGHVAKDACGARPHREEAAPQWNGE